MTSQKTPHSIFALPYKPRSPFTPGNPVPPELFVGRAAQIAQLRRCAEQACSGRQESVFLSGDRGIGKSSLAHFVRELCATQLNMLGVHVFLGSESTVDGLVHRVFQGLLQQTRGEPWFSKIQELFGKHVRKVGLFGITLEFAPPKEDLQGIAREFPRALANLYESVRHDKKGLLIILDDINGLADKREFADWYKSLVDSMATLGRACPLVTMLCGLSDRRDSLAALQPSLMRIFRVVDIERLDHHEVEQFLRQAFQTVNVRLTDDAAKSIVWFCSGLPALMHEIGDATYWADTDGVIDAADTASGLAQAAANVGQKYLDPRVFNAIRSPRYRTILAKLVNDPDEEVFRKAAVEARLDGAEKRVFGNFLRKMRELGVIESDAETGRGSYRFVNRVFPIYIFMQSRAAKSRG